MTSIVTFPTGTYTLPATDTNGNLQISSFDSGTNASASTFWRGDGTWVTPSSGTVTSVTFTGDGTVLSSTPSSAVTSSGTLNATLNTQSANTVLAGPTSGGAAAPTFRSLVRADLPSRIWTSSVIPHASAISPPNGSFSNFTSISLAAGTWNVWGNLFWSNGAGNVITAAAGGISKVSGTMPDQSLIGQMNVTGASTEGLCIPMQQLVLTSTTTIYMVQVAAWTSGTTTLCGGLYAEQIA